MLRAWRHLTAANKHARVRCLENHFFAWLLEQREAANAVHKLAHLLQRAIGTSPAFAYWRVVLDKRKRRPRPPDCPSVGEAIDRCMLLAFARNFLAVWRKYHKRLKINRERAASRLQSAARPMNLWPSEVLSLALLMWNRIAKFRRCQRKGEPPPVYMRYLPQWHEWETRAIQKQLRAEVANELHGPSLLRRLLRKCVCRS